MKNKNAISVIGLGKLGVCSAACLALKGFNVIGVDISKNCVDSINNGRVPIQEPGLQETIDRARGRFKATHSYEEAVKESDITFLIVPTPSKDDGHFSDEYLQDCLKHLSNALRTTPKEYHLFVITSTVSPGTTDERLIPLIEAESGKKLNKDFGVCYNPEFIALGSVIKDFLNPDMLLIGESDQRAGDIIEWVYKRTCENKPYYARMSIISAEITKISLNCYVTMKISFANTLANICEKIPNTDVDAIAKALGSDRRVSPYYLKGGLSFGGPCFPRDNQAFMAFTKQYNYDAKLARATDEVNMLQTEILANRVFAHMAEGQKNVAILGLAYKPDTPVIDESPSIKLIEILLKRKLELIVYDPLAMDNTQSHFGDVIQYATSARDCFARSSLCIIATQISEFKAIDESYIVHLPTTIIDCWRILDSKTLSHNVHYIAVGRS